VEVVGGWSLSSRRLTGRVILAEVLSMSPERLVEYVREAEIRLFSDRLSEQVAGTIR